MDEFSCRHTMQAYTALKMVFAHTTRETPM